MAAAVDADNSHCWCRCARCDDYCDCSSPFADIKAHFRHVRLPPRSRSAQPPFEQSPDPSSPPWAAHCRSAR